MLGAVGAGVVARLCRVAGVIRRRLHTVRTDPPESCAYQANGFGGRCSARSCRYHLFDEKKPARRLIVCCTHDVTRAAPEGLSQYAVAEILGVTRQYVDKIEYQAKAALAPLLRKT